MAYSSNTAGAIAGLQGTIRNVEAAKNQENGASEEDCGLIEDATDCKCSALRLLFLGRCKCGDKEVC